MVSPPAVADEADLVQRVAHGDRQAFLELYDRHAPRVYALALRMLGETMAAEEVTQDAFLKLWTRAGGFNPHRGSLLAWLLTITRRTALDRIRFDNRRPEFAASIELEDCPASESTSEEGRWRSLRLAVQDLPLEQRQAIELAFYHGMSHSQIAEFLSIPLGTAKTRLRLGVDKLRRMWLEDDFNLARRSNPDSSDVG